MLKGYIRIALAVLILLLGWGYALPRMISAPDDTLVLVGIVLALASVPLIAWLTYGAVRAWDVALDKAMEKKHVEKS